MDANNRNQNAIKVREIGIGMGLALAAALLVALTLYAPAWGVRVWLLFFGVGYDQFVGWLHRTGRERGVTAILVVGGVMVTLFGAGVLMGWGWMWAVAELFIYSGTPMIVGAWKRYTDERQRDEEEARALARRMGLGEDDAETQN